MRRLAIAVTLAGTLTALTSSAAFAGILNLHPAAFGGITGTVNFDDGAGLEGTVDYAVFVAAAFNANFAGLGYVPGDALVYAYQIENHGAVAITAFELSLAGVANTIGDFGPLNAGDVAPASAAFVGSDAQWLFGGIPIGLSSYGLAYASSALPMVGSFEVSAGRQTVLGVGVPTPFANPVPEPGSLVLLAVGGLMISLRRRCTHQKRVRDIS